MAGKKVGLSCKLFNNTGTFAVPVWAEITIARDVTLNMEAGEAEASSRANTFREYLQALKDAGIEFDMLFDGADVQFGLIKDAYFDNTTLDLLALDGASATSGNSGLRMVCVVTGFTRNEPLEEAVTVAVTVKPTPNADSPPVWFTVP
jgi:hypothetical protein